MFTGLIETVGTVAEVRSRGNYRVFGIESELPLDEIVLGESIACDGPCLTVVAVEAGRFVVEASQETLARTTLGGFASGRRLNLERALQVGSRLGGHFVSGHIDDAGTLEYARQVGESWELAVIYDPQFDPLVIEKGSIAINGVSLTVNACRTGRLTVNLIPHTYEATALRYVAPGGKVNLEFDLIGKYIIKMSRGKESGGLTKDKLLESGW
jgi:riboflavin synthase